MYDIIKIGLVEFDNEEIAIRSFEEFTNSKISDENFENFNWKKSKNFKESEILIRIAVKNVNIIQSGYREKISKRGI